ncbi:MAG: hypothetical protein PHE11_07930 [Candidatus Omnitrophica bacterium]|nr:hypothetical protein [Candidatus Omnitrophota bacterium]
MADLKIVISALNKASGDIKKVKSDIEGLGKAGKNAEGGLKAVGAGLSAAWQVGLSAAAAIGAAAGAVKLLSDAAQEGAAFQRMEEASGSLAVSMNADMDVILEALRGASLGMVSDFDLMQAASRAMMLGVSADAGQLSQLMEVAALRGRAMGLSTTQAFNDIVTGIGRASPLILDNLGIVVDAEARYKAYADSIGKTSEELSKAEKTQALLNGVLESSAALLQSTGGLTVDNAGKWEQLSAAQKNYFDAVKSDLADATSWWADYWAAVFTEKKQAHDLNEIWEQARELGIISAELQDAYSQYRMGGISANDTQFLLENAAAIEILGEKIDSAKTKTNDWADANYDTGASFESIAEVQAMSADEIALLTAEMERQAKIQEELASVTSLTKNFSGMINYAKQYDKVLEDIVEQETIMANNPIGSEKYDEAKAKVDELKQAMADMANQVVLDMFQATIAVGGVTEAELAAYFDMAIQMGYVSEEGAAAAMDAYGKAIETINSYKIDPKTGNITFTVEPVVTITKDVEAYKPTSKKMLVEAELGTAEVDYYDAPIKEMIVNAIVDTSEIDAWNPPTKYANVVYIPKGDTDTGSGNAVGGNVYAGNPYTWQEYGYRGELFIPSQDGYILSRADAERALSRALVEGKSGGGEIDYERLADVLSRVVNGNSKSQKGGNTYNLNVQGGGSPSRDVAATFDLLRAYGGNF